MREVNFSVPSANRASVGITTALYDRRALDCTSTLPLVNSLNHLAYLTTSSPRIREILTIDGGIERLVYLLKCGKTKEMMDTWKWSLAFQCVVNVAVRGSDAKGADNRGSESIRTRVVEADIVPVVTTILDNYMQVVDRIRTRQEEAEKQRKEASKRTLSNDAANTLTADVNPARLYRNRHAHTSADGATDTPFPTHVPIINIQTENIFESGVPRLSDTPPPPPPASRATLNSSQESTNRPGNGWLTVQTFGGQQPMSPSQPNTPSTPQPLNRLPVLTTRYPTRRRSASAGYLLPVTTQQQDLSMSGDSDDGDTSPPRTTDNGVPHEPVDMEMNVGEPTLIGVGTARPTLPDPDVTGDDEAETFSITHRSLNGSIIEPAAAPAETLAMSPATPFGLIDEVHHTDTHTGIFSGRAQIPSLFSCMPRDEDVIMALQLLAYVSKYCNLRSYFEQTHLVPKLRNTRELQLVEMQEAQDNLVGGEDLPAEEDNDDEYCRPQDYNIFPLVEKFTVRHHSSDMNYWACVVMRNLCRKDKSRGDIRQCAYWKCGKWEEFARQFAKCRRCRQTKYCSKHCQKASWCFHRHWCEPAKEASQGQHHRSSRHAGMDIDGGAGAPGGAGGDPATQVPEVQIESVI